MQCSYEKRGSLEVKTDYLHESLYESILLHNHDSEPSGFTILCRDILTFSISYY